MNWGDIVRTPEGEVGKAYQTFTLMPQRIEVVEVEAGCLMALWRPSDLEPATQEELEVFERGE